MRNTITIERWQLDEETMTVDMSRCTAENVKTAIHAFLHGGKKNPVDRIDTQEARERAGKYIAEVYLDNEQQKEYLQEHAFHNAYLLFLEAVERTSEELLKVKPVKKIDSYRINDGCHEVLMSLDVAEEIKSVLKGFWAGVGARYCASGTMVLEERAGKHIAKEYLKDKKSKKYAASNYVEFFEAVEKRVEELTK